MDKSISIIESLCINLWSKQTYKICGCYSSKMKSIPVRAGPELLKMIVLLSVWQSIRATAFLYTVYS